MNYLSGSTIFHLDETGFDPQTLLQQVGMQPGVYIMRGANSEIIYVGKAWKLRQRLASYFRGSQRSAKTLSLVSRIESIEIAVTQSESEALLLEQNLIKHHRPRYNVLYRDDKSFPYIALTMEHAFPRVTFYRGARRTGFQFYGPYPNAVAVRETIKAIQRVFRLRTCRDAVFTNRARPCLLYQLERCSAPCTGQISREDYARDVRDAGRFLAGHGDKVFTGLAARMERAASELQFEQAAMLRDRIVHLRMLRERQHVASRLGDLDAVVIATRGALACAMVSQVRQGMLVGQQALFSQHHEASMAHLRANLIVQYYMEHAAPLEIITDGPVQNVNVVEQALFTQHGCHTRIRNHVRGDRQGLLDSARVNAEERLRMRASAHGVADVSLRQLQVRLQLHQVPQHMECFDISHSSGEAPVASCVVCRQGIMVPGEYRRFNIRNIRGGDDYAAMAQAVQRRYIPESGKNPAILPDVLLIDGGKGQVGAVLEVLSANGLREVVVIGIAKGRSRKAGEETLILSHTGEELHLEAHDEALRLLQRIRDEAHRFAVVGHRRRRQNQRRSSSLEQIQGLGPVRRRQLLNHFGGARRIGRADVVELMTVPGINRQLAQRVYDYFHDSGANQ